MRLRKLGAAVGAAVAITLVAAPAAQAAVLPPAPIGLFFPADGLPVSGGWFPGNQPSNCMWLSDPILGHAWLCYPIF